jgi:hypothetical protein
MSPGPLQVLVFLAANSEMVVSVGRNLQVQLNGCDIGYVTCCWLLYCRTLKAGFEMALLRLLGLSPKGGDRMR